MHNFLFSVKKIFTASLSTFVVYILYIGITYGQTTVTIGDEINSTQNFFVNRYYNFSRWEAIYMQSEINTTGDITKIRFDKANVDDGSNITNVKVYMKHTTAATLVSGNWSSAGYTEVFNGTVTNGSPSGWKTITLDTPFPYNNLDNLKITIDHGYQAYINYYPEWRYTVLSVTRNRREFSDYQMPSYLSATTGRANIKIVFENLTPIAGAGENKSICPGDNIAIGGSPTGSGGSGSGYTYTWSPAAGLSSTTEANPVASPAQTTTYSVTVTDGLGATSLPDEVTVYVAAADNDYLADNDTTYYVLGGKFYDSGGQGSAYSYNQDFTVTFMPCDAGQKLKFDFTLFDLEYEQNCNYDWLKIYDGPDTGSPLLGKYCGTNNPGEVISTHTSGALTFVFHSDPYVTGEGWEADISYACDQPVADAGEDKRICNTGGNITIGGNPSGSGGSGSGYTYRWTPTDGLNDPAAANPTANPAATTTYTLIVTDGQGCTSEPDEVVVTVSEPGTEYYTDQDAEFIVSSGKFYDSGGQGSAYSYNQDFTVTFMPCDAGQKLKFDFTLFDLEYEQNCNYDWLKIYDGPDIGSTLIGRYCGTDSPGEIISTYASGALTFVFHSDPYVTGEGWEADISYACNQPVADAGEDKRICNTGGNITIGGNPSGSGGSGSDYTYRWTPTDGLDDPAAATPTASPATTTTYTLVVTDGEGCTSDPDEVVITVIEPGTEYYTDQDAEFIVSSGKFYDSGGSAAGYSYNEDYTVTFYPCDPDYKLKFEFTLFDVEFNSSCDWDFLAVYDGPDINNPLLGTYCGTDNPGEIISTHASGALTFVFHSDPYVTGEGWEADISYSCEPPISDAGPDKFLYNTGDSVIIGGSPAASGGSGSGYTYQWSPAEGLDNPAIANPKAGPAETTIYSLVVTDGEGCSSLPDEVALIICEDSIEYYGNKDTTFYACSGKFYDSGGQNGDYFYNEYYTTTFYPCGINRKVKITFTDFDVEYAPDCYWDWLKIYDGPDKSAPLSGTYCGTTGPGEIISTHETGALTFEFWSDYIITGAGWVADVGCEIMELTDFSGTYTVGGGIADFYTITAAVNALDGKNIAGDVIFHVNEGSYNEKINFNNNILYNSDGSYTISFYPNPENTNNIIISYPDNPLSIINKRDLKFSGLTFNPRSTSVACNIENSENIIIEKSVFSDVVSGTQAFNISNIKKLVLNDNVIDNFSYGIQISGTSENIEMNNNRIQVDNNALNLTGITDKLIIIGNDISGNTTNVYIANCNAKTVVQGNKLESANGYNIFAKSYATRLFISENDMISNTGEGIKIKDNTPESDILDDQDKELIIYHNYISADDKGIHIYNAKRSGILILNNIIENATTGLNIEELENTAGKEMKIFGNLIVSPERALRIINSMLTTTIKSNTLIGEEECSAATITLNNVHNTNFCSNNAIKMIGDGVIMFYNGTHITTSYNNWYSFTSGFVSNNEAMIMSATDMKLNPGFVEDQEDYENADRYGLSYQSDLLNKPGDCRDSLIFYDLFGTYRDTNYDIGAIELPSSDWDGIKVSFNLERGIAFYPDGGSEYDAFDINGLDNYNSVNLKVFGFDPAGSYSVLVHDSNSKTDDWDGTDMNTQQLVDAGFYKYLLTLDSKQLEGMVYVIRN